MQPYLQHFIILKEKGIIYKSDEKSFEGVVYLSKDLEEITNIFYLLGFTYYTEGDYSEGVFIKTTGEVKNDNI